LLSRQQAIECVQKDLEGHANNQRTVQRVLLLVPADKFHHGEKRKKMLCANKEESVSTYGMLWYVSQSGIRCPDFVSIGRPFQSRNEFERKAVPSMATSLALLVSGVV
jgi:hypothetical protein